MTSATYPEEMPVTQARARYFEDNGFGADGGYDDAFVELALGPVKIPFPNTKGRARAVRYHDLHHLVTGYGTDFASETAISAWEIGAGCGTSVAAWLIDLSAMGVGIVAQPRLTWRAFLRGRRSKSLFMEPFEPLLALSVGELRARVAVPDAEAPLRGRAVDALAFGAASVGGAIAAPLVLLGTLALLPFGLRALGTKR